MDKIDNDVRVITDWIKQERDKFSSIDYVYNTISESYDNIEFVKKGVVKINPYRQIYTGEKGVDIALAVKMIALSVEKKCDKIILVSGDYDYAEAIKYVKNNMTRIHIVRFFQGEPPKCTNFSTELAELADRIIPIYESRIKENYLLSNIS
jgi:uncharacterized LabA/DUF88 family protein